MSWVLVFDLDDTLYLEQEFIFSGFYAVEKKIKVSNFREKCIELYNNGCKNNIFNQALNSFGINYDANFIKKLVNIYRLHRPSINLLADAKWALENFFSKYPMAVITDGYLTTQQNKINALKIRKYFEQIIYTDQKGLQGWKPNPWSYIEIEKRYFGEQKKFVYIGDNVKKDFITPRERGWHTICVARDKGVYNNLQAEATLAYDVRIDTLHKLKNFIIR